MCLSLVHTSGPQLARFLNFLYQFSFKYTHLHLLIKYSYAAWMSVWHCHRVSKWKWAGYHSCKLALTYSLNSHGSILCHLCVAVMFLWGGQTKPHSDAQEDSWKKILCFLQHHMYSNPFPKAKMWMITWLQIDPTSTKRAFHIWGHSMQTFRVMFLCIYCKINLCNHVCLLLFDMNCERFNSSELYVFENAIIELL